MLWSRLLDRRFQLVIGIQMQEGASNLFFVDNIRRGPAHFCEISVDERIHDLHASVPEISTVSRGAPGEYGVHQLDVWLLAAL